MVYPAGALSFLRSGRVAVDQAMCPGQRAVIVPGLRLSRWDGGVAALVPGENELYALVGERSAG